jgi:CRP/FNR family transcriptional regulator
MNVEVFNRVPEEKLNRLAHLATYRRLKPDEIICEQGDLWPNVILLITGQLRWSLLALSGREQVLFHIEPDQTFWGHSFYDGFPMPGSLCAVRSSVAYQWSGDDLKPFFSEHPEALWELFRVQARAMRKAREIIYGLAFQPVAGRLAKLLLERSQGQIAKPIERDLTLSEIASIVASSQQVICRLLYQFQSDGILQINRASITIQDFPALEQITEED